jgi:hypothetical protein
LYRVIAISVILSVLHAGAEVWAGVDGAVDMPRIDRTDALPATLGGYPTASQAARHAARLLQPPSDPESRVAASMQPDAEPGQKRKYLPVFLSALVPGAGELYLGHVKRGIALMAVEAGAWTGYFYKHEQGLDTRDEYEAFADEHWGQRRWLEHHYGLWFEGRDYSGVTTEQLMEEAEEWGVAGSGSGVWPGYSPWVSKEEDKQHYYENIGKYDWYVSGWEDYVPGTTPDDLAPGEVLSLRREEYRELRMESNDQLDAADRFIYLSIAARVVSLVQTTLLVTRSQQGDDMARTDNHWMFRARSYGRDSGEVALEYWFK